MEKSSHSAIVWFRKGLRLHDNPAFVEACRRSRRVYPVFIIDPHFAKPDIVGVNRYNFLLETLSDLHGSLVKLGSRLYVVQGKPDEELPLLFDQWNIDLLTFESDTEPYARQRDARISVFCESKGIRLSTHSSHTLFHPEAYLSKAKGNIPSTYQSFQKIFAACGRVRDPVPVPTSGEVPSVSEEDRDNQLYNVPTLVELGYTETPTTSFRGGETEALARLQRLVIDRPQWVAAFEKPNTHPNSLEPSTTVNLSCELS
jgi:cryptochrome